MEQHWDRVDPGTSGAVLTGGMCSWHCANTLGYWAEPLCPLCWEGGGDCFHPALTPLWPLLSCSDFFLRDWSACPHGQHFLPQFLLCNFL